MAGGVVGSWVEEDNDDIGGGIGESTQIRRCYGAGEVQQSGENGVFSGGLVGFADGSALSAEDSYYDEDTTGEHLTQQGDGLSTGEFAEEASFSGWGFGQTEEWQMGQAPDGEQRPVLLWQNAP